MNITRIMEIMTEKEIIDSTDKEAKTIKKTNQRNRFERIQYGDE